MNDRMLPGGPWWTPPPTKRRRILRPLMLGLLVLCGVAVLVAELSKEDDDAGQTAAFTEATPRAVVPALPSGSPTTPNPAEPALGTRLDRPIPLGQVGRVGGWDVRVISIGTLERDGFDKGPPPGFAYVLLTIEATRVDPEPESALFLTPRVLGRSRRRTWRHQRPAVLRRLAISRHRAPRRDRPVIALHKRSRRRRRITRGKDRRARPQRALVRHEVVCAALPTPPALAPFGTWSAGDTESDQHHESAGHGSGR